MKTSAFSSLVVKISITLLLTIYVTFSEVSAQAKPSHTSATKPTSTASSVRKTFLKDAQDLAQSIESNGRSNAYVTAAREDMIEWFAKPLPTNIKEHPAILRIMTRQISLLRQCEEMRERTITVHFSSTPMSVSANTRATELYRGTAHILDDMLKEVTNTSTTAHTEQMIKWTIGFQDYIQKKITEAWATYELGQTSAPSEVPVPLVGTGQEITAVRQMNGTWYSGGNQSDALKYIWNQSEKFGQEHIAVITTEGLVVLPPSGFDENGKFFKNERYEVFYNPMKAGTLIFDNGWPYIYHHNTKLRVLGTIHTHPSDANPKTRNDIGESSMIEDASSSITNLGATYAISSTGLRAAGWLAGKPNQMSGLISSLKETLSSKVDIIENSKSPYYATPLYFPSK
jgi:hypothetical protein